MNVTNLLADRSAPYWVTNGIALGDVNVMVPDPEAEDFEDLLAGYSSVNNNASSNREGVAEGGSSNTIPASSSETFYIFTAPFDESLAGDIKVMVATSATRTYGGAAMEKTWEAMNP